jgi:DNA polymerase epsilon subunit 1
VNESTNRDERVESTRFSDEIDRRMGFERYEGGKKQRIGWLINMHTTMLVDEDKGGQKSAVDFYFLDEDGGGFKATLQYNPYFLIATKVICTVMGLMCRVAWKLRLRNICDGGMRI